MIFSESQSHIVEKPQILRPLLRNSLESMKGPKIMSLPPVISYDPVVDQVREYQRPPYVTKEINHYPELYKQSLDISGTYAKRQGMFESYVELLNQNSDLIKVKKKASEPFLPQIKPAVPHFPHPKKRSHPTAHDTYQNNEREQFLNHDNRFFNKVKFSIDKELIRQKIPQRKQKHQSRTAKMSPQIKALSQQYKIQSKLGDFQSQVPDVLYDDDEISDVLSKNNDWDVDDHLYLLQNLKEFDTRVKHLKEFQIQEEMQNKRR